jgi:hypothetical protein
MPVSDRVISNVIVLGRELNIVQLESDPVSTLACTARASREALPNAQQRECYGYVSIRT